MTNAKLGKKSLAVAFLACLVALIVSVPAYAYYHVHDEDVSTGSGAKGVIEVFVVLDETNVGGTATSSLIFMPADATAEDCLLEAIVSSKCQAGLDAIHNYDATRLADYLDGSNIAIDVYAAGSQNPGTHTTYDTTPKGGADSALERFDNVVITVG